MTRHRLGIAMAVALPLALASGLSAQNLEVELQRAINRHSVTREHDAAIEAYRRIAEQADASGLVGIAVDARLRLAEAYRESSDAKAREVYEEIIARYPAHAATAQRRLDEMPRSVAIVRSPTPPAAHPPARPAVVAVGDPDDADSSAYITPDGHLLFRIDWETGDIVIRDLRTGQGRRLLDKQAWDDNWPESPLASPDGSQVLYTWWNEQDPGPGYQLRIMPARVGATPRQLLSGAEFNYLAPIGWSPDGRRALVFGATPDDAQLLWVDTADGTWWLLKSLGQSDGTGRYSLSPDGRYVAYSRLAKPKERNAQGRWLVTAPEQHIYVLPTSGPGEEVALVTGNNINEAPVWTPDGKRILFVSNRGADNQFGLWAVAVEDGRRTGGEMYVERGPTGRVSPIGVTDAGALYYVPERLTPGMGLDIFVAELEAPGGRVTAAPVRLLDTNLDSNMSAAWSPDRDGRRVAFVRARPDARNPNERYEVGVYSLGTGSERTLFRTYLGNTAPVWLRDGSALLVRRDYNNGELLLWNPDAEGEPKSIENIAHATLPTGWRTATPSADGRVLYFLVPGRDRDRRLVDQRIVAFDLETGEEQIVWTLPGQPGSGAVRLALSPDGQSLAGILRQADWTHPRLLHIPLNGGSHRELTDAVVSGSVVWAPDGGSILVTRADDQGDLVWVSVADGHITPVGLPMRVNRTFDLSPDGRRLVFTAGTRDPSALMAYENLLLLVK